MENRDEPRKDAGPDGADGEPERRTDGDRAPDASGETLEETIARLKREAVTTPDAEGPQDAEMKEAESPEKEEKEASGKEEAEGKEAEAPKEEEKEASGKEEAEGKEAEAPKEEEKEASGKEEAEGREAESPEKKEAEAPEKTETEAPARKEGGKRARHRRTRQARRAGAAAPTPPEGPPSKPAAEDAGWRRPGRAGQVRLVNVSEDSNRKGGRVRMTSERRVGRVIGMGIGLVIIIFAVLGVVLDMLEVIPAGHKGVIITSPGGPSDIEIDEGYQFSTRYIWADVEVVEYRTQTVHFVGADYADDEMGSVQIITNDSMPIFLDLSVVYHIQEDRVADLILDNGVDYQHRIIYPYVRSIARDVASRYQALDIIGDKRSVVESTIQQTIITKMAEKYIIVEGVPMRDVRIPANLESAIISKKVAEQTVLTEQYNLIARQYIANQTIVNSQANATAYIIEQTGFANGTVVRAIGQAEAIEHIIAALNSTDYDNRTKDYLTWAYIQALTDPNTKVKFVVVPASGAPIILDVSGEQ